MANAVAGPLSLQAMLSIYRFSNPVPRVTRRRLCLARATGML